MTGRSCQLHCLLQLINVFTSQELINNNTNTDDRQTDRQTDKETDK